MDRNGARTRLRGALGALVLIAGVTPAPAQRFSNDGFAAADYGAGQGYRFSSIHHPRFWVGSFSHQDLLWEARRVPRADRPSALRRAAQEPEIRYTVDQRDLGIDDYLDRHPATGLLIAQGRVGGDTLLVERYRYARRDTHRFASFSMAKTVTAMLIGIALAEGRIRSLDDPPEAYEPALAGSEYGRTPLRHLLQMSSGVRFSEHYSGRDDIQRLWLETVVQVGPGGAAAVKPFNERHRAAGAVFAYSSAETQVLGLVLAKATGRSLADYLAERIWKPMGAESEASWLIDAAGQEAAYCCLNAVLRDWGRLALLLANDGRQGARQLIPADWVREATRLDPDRPDLDVVWPDPQFGYGYQTWLMPGGPGQRRPFALVGLHGQAIFVDPTSRLVLVHTAVRPLWSGPGDWRELLALWHAALRHVRSGEPGATPRR